MVSTSSPIITELNFVHWNIPLPVVEGILQLTLSSPVQSLKALLPMDVTLLGIVTEVRAEQ